MSLGSFAANQIVPASGDEEFATSGRATGVSAGSHTITFVIGNVTTCICTIAAVPVGAGVVCIGATLTA